LRMRVRMTDNGWPLPLPRRPCGSDEHHRVKFEVAGRFGVNIGC